MNRLGASALLAVALLVGTAAGCTAGSPERERAAVDTRLDTHAVIEGEPSEAGLRYVQAIAEAHRTADRLSDHKAQIDTLRSAIELRWPDGDGTAELLHYETLARASELLLAAGDSEQVVELLTPRVAPERSLPLDRASARCLVALGDAAAHTGDHALAMGSYARALEMLMMLLEEVEP